MPRRASSVVSAQVPHSVRVELDRRAAAGYRNRSSEIRLAIDAHLGTTTVGGGRQRDSAIIEALGDQAPRYFQPTS